MLSPNLCLRHVLYAFLSLQTIRTKIIKSLYIFCIFFSLQPVPNTPRDYLERGLGNIFNLLSVISAACNFVLYCAMSKRYRRTFLQTFCCHWYRRHSPLHSLMATTAYSNVDDGGSPRFSRISSVRVTSRRSSCRYVRFFILSQNGGVAFTELHESKNMSRKTHFT